VKLLQAIHGQIAALVLDKPQLDRSAFLGVSGLHEIEVAQIGRQAMPAAATPFTTVRPSGVKLSSLSAAVVGRAVRDSEVSSVR